MATSSLKCRSPQQAPGSEREGRRCSQTWKRNNRRAGPCSRSSRHHSSYFLSVLCLVCCDDRCLYLYIYFLSMAYDRLQLLRCSPKRRHVLGRLLFAARYESMVENICLHGGAKRDRGSLRSLLIAFPFHRLVFSYSHAFLLRAVVRSCPPFSSSPFPFSTQ